MTHDNWHHDRMEMYLLLRRISVLKSYTVLNTYFIDVVGWYGGDRILTSLGQYEQ